MQTSWSAGGSEAALAPIALAGFQIMRALSIHNDLPTQASRPFDKNRDGFMLAERAGVAVPEKWEHARGRGARIYRELKGYVAIRQRSLKKTGGSAESVGKDGF
jgi:3-oxoacyl-[acyl-carrier-protein] synthase II